MADEHVIPRSKADIPAPVTLVTKADAAAEQVRIALQEVVAEADKSDCVGLACVLVGKDGRTWVRTYGRGNRVLMLGAVADLQHTIAKDGDAP